VRRPHAPLVRTELYGDGEPRLDDPAELFHEASKLHPALGMRQAAGLARLASNEELQTAAKVAARSNPQLSAHGLPTPRRPRCSLWAAFERRQSRRDFDGAWLAERSLATVLDSGYGMRAGNGRRVPSGGALYPLELYVAAHRVDGVDAGVYRFDPRRHALEELDRSDPWTALEAACVFPGLLEGAAAVVLVVAVFGRTRFKYGQRGYRFALLEAGHVVQNVVLAAAALDLPALPLGGFYDAQVDALLDIDGVEESVVYGVVVGGAR
jgi:SagB-type dehydrogenase family enzyme